MTASGQLLQPNRRSFLTAVAATGGGLMIGFPLRAEAQQAAATNPNAFIRISSSGGVTLILPYVEMGQGAYTSQVQLLAEELEVDPLSVKIEHAPPDEVLYASPLFGDQITGGSGSLRGAWMTLRAAGAATREMLVEAAARRWKVRASSCVAANGVISHTGSGRKLAYGAVANAAARLPVPRNPKLKTQSQFKVVGNPMRRLDTPEKITGQAMFGIDARPPGVQYAAVAACPVFGGTLATVDTAPAMLIKGVSQVVRLDDAVAVVASNTWAARKGLAALEPIWNEGANADLTIARLTSLADAALHQPGRIFSTVGDISEAEAKAASLFTADFRQPILAHAAMEPINCTVHVKRDACEVWVGSQVVGRVQKAAAEATGLPLSKVVVHNHLLGGGFGRRLEVDYVTQATLIAKQVDGPVKVTWSREEDIQHDAFRYLNHSRITVALDAAGKPIGWRHKIVGPNIMSRFLPVYQQDGIDLDIVDSAAGPYSFQNAHIEVTHHEAPKGLFTGNWRGVGATRNVWIVESVIDDLAHKAGEDPIGYRRGLLGKEPRVRAALDRAATEAGWGEPLPPGSGRGAAAFAAFGSYLGMVARVSVSARGDVKVERVVCAVDTGVVVNPDVVRAQIEGGIIFGLSAVLHGRITVARGRIEQGNFDTYPVLRMREAPRIDVHIIDSQEEPGGVGEPGTSGVIAAVANAVFAATGKRALSLPLDASFLRSA